MPTGSSTLRRSVSACDWAREARATARTRLTEGWIDRVARSLLRAESICPQGAQSAWGELIEALEGLGDVGALRALCARARASARTSLAERAEQAAVSAGRAETDPTAVVEAARAALAAGALAQAHRLFDRAGLLLRKATGEDASVEFVGGSPHEPKWSPDGTAIAFLEGDHAAVIDAASGAYRLWLQIPESKPEWVDFTSGDRVSVIARGSLHFWSVATGRAEGTADTQGWAVGLHGWLLSPQRDVLAFWSDNGFSVGDLLTGTTRPAGAENENYLVWHAAFSPDGHALAVTYLGGGLDVIDPRTGARARRLIEPVAPDGMGGGEEESTVAFSPDMRWLVQYGPGYFHVWDTRTYRRRSIRDHSLMRLTPEAFHRGAFVTAQSERIVSFDPSRLTVRKSPGTDASGYSLGVWSDGARLHVLWGDPEPSQPKAATNVSLVEHILPAFVFAATVSPDRRRVAFVPTGEELDSLRVWDLGAATSRELVGPRPGRALVSVALGPPYIAVGDGETVRAWDLRSGALVLRDRAGGGMLDISGDGKLLALRCCTRVDVWNIERGQRLGSIESQGAKVRGLAFRPDGRMLAIGFTGAIQVWDPQTRSVVRSMVLRGEADPQELAFVDDGTALYAVGSRFDLKTGARTSAERPRSLYFFSTNGNRRSTACTVERVDDAGSVFVPFELIERAAVEEKLDFARVAYAPD
ncbi:MAG: WD40 repeat domain-containing protein, partial [Polyangiaceae bacterium]|nr:WD40 repeat domain-containing protein [Polyangiaceae bacterium]